MVVLSPMDAYLTNPTPHRVAGSRFATGHQYRRVRGGGPRPGRDRSPGLARIERCGAPGAVTVVRAYSGACSNYGPERWCPRPAPKEGSGSRPVSAATGQDRLLRMRPRTRLRCTGRCTTRPAPRDMWSGRCSCSPRRSHPGTDTPRTPSPHYTAEARHRRDSRATCTRVVSHHRSTRHRSRHRRCRLAAIHLLELRDSRNHRQGWADSCCSPGQ